MSSGTHVSRPVPTKAQTEPSDALWGVVSLLLGLLVAIPAAWAMAGTMVAYAPQRHSLPLMRSRISAASRST